MSPGLMKEISPYIVPLFVVFIVGRRLLRNPARKVKTNRIFLLPGFLVVATAITIWSTRLPSLWWLGIYVLAGVAGGVVGFLSAHHQEFTLDYDTGTISSKATPLGTILFAALFAARFGLRFIMPDVAGSPYQASSYVPNSPLPSVPPHAAGAVLGWTDAGLIFSAAMLVARVATTWLRAQPLIAAHKDHLASKNETSA